MSSKSSRISLYSSDALTEKGLHLVALDAKSSITSPNPFEVSATVFSLSGQTVAANDISDLGQKISDMAALQASDNSARSAGITTNLGSISALTATEGANHAAQAALLGAETARATTAETTLQSNIDSEAVTARAAESVNAAAVATEQNRAVAAESQLATDYKAADAGLQSQITALGVVDTTTLASINSMLAAYQAADNSISSLITALTSRVQTLEAQVATLTA